MIELDAPPAGEVRWVAWPINRRNDGVGVDAQTWFFARQKAAALLGLEPTQIEVRMVK